jgi:hypothetical protein
MPTTVTTLNQIVQNLNSIADNHQQLHGFKFGNPWDFYTSGICDAAEMWVAVNSAAATRRSTDFKFTMWLLDGVRRGDVNELEVQSDMTQVATDVIAQLRHPDYGWSYDMESSVTMSVVQEKTPYRFAGVSFDFEIKLMYPQDTCRIPFTNTPTIYPLQ